MFLIFPVDFLWNMLHLLWSAPAGLRDVAAFSRSSSTRLRPCSCSCPYLAVLCLRPCCPCIPLPNASISIGSSPSGCERSSHVWSTRVSSVLTVRSHFFTQESVRRQPHAIQLHRFLEVSSRAAMEHLVCCSCVSRDLPCSRWHPSVLGGFARCGDRISLKRLRARPTIAWGTSFGQPAPTLVTTITS